MPDAQIISKFNAEIRGLYNYYRLAANVSVLNNFYRIMRGSLFKTFGCKYRTTYKHIKAKYVRDGIFSVKYSTKGGDKELQFYHDGFQQNVKAAPDFSDIMPNFRKYTKERSLLHRLKNGICELCGAETKEIVMHHVRKLKDLKGETEWERVMLRIRRKSLALCHTAITASKPKFCRRRAGYAERCPSGSGGGALKPTGEIRQGAASPTSSSYSISCAKRRTMCTAGDCRSMCGVL